MNEHSSRGASCKRVAMLWVVLSIVLSACTLISDQIQATPESHIPDSAFTQAAGTLAAEMTREAGITAVAQLTQIAAGGTPSAPTPSPTEPPPPTAQPEVPPTPTPPPTETPPPTPTPVPCDWAQFVGDVTIPPDASLPVGTRFIKTWRVLNAGACTWTTAWARARLSES